MLRLFRRIDSPLTHTLLQAKAATKFAVKYSLYNLAGWVVTFGWAIKHNLTFQNQPLLSYATMHTQCIYAGRLLIKTRR